MFRPLRIEYPGAVYHVTSRGNERKLVFKDDHDRDNFLNTLQHVNTRYNWTCHAYCLMTNHYRLLIETPDGNLYIGMRQLNGVFTQFVNKRHGRTGHLFQGRYKAVLIQKDSHLLEVCRCVVLNPVRATMVEKPEEYPWSSYPATAGRTKPHPCLTADRVLGEFARRRVKAEKEYRQFVSPRHRAGDHLDRGEGPSPAGRGEFVDKLTDHLRKHRDIPEIPRGQRYALRPGLEKLFGAPVRANLRKRREAIRKAVEQYGHRQQEIADHLGLHYSSVSRIMKGER